MGLSTEDLGHKIAGGHAGRGVSRLTGSMNSWWCSRRRCALAFLASLLVAIVVLAGCGGSEHSSMGSTSGATAGTGAVGGKPPLAQNVSDLHGTDYAMHPAGEDYTFKARDNGLLVVYFGYLSCPDICPLTMVDTANGVRGLGAAASRVDVAFVTVDMERDKPDNLRNYLTHFFPEGNAHGVRAKDDIALLNLTYRFGAVFKIDPHTPGTNYGVAHSGNTYVVDDEGNLLWVWPFGTNGAQITATLQTLLPASAT